MTVNEMVAVLRDTSSPRNFTDPQDIKMLVHATDAGLCRLVPVDDEHDHEMTERGIKVGIVLTPKGRGEQT